MAFRRVVKRRMSVAATVAGAAAMLFWVVLLAQPAPLDCPRGNPLGSPPRAIGDPLNGCRSTIFAGENRPAPAKAYRGSGYSYPGPRPLTLRDERVEGATLLAAVVLLVVGTRGILSTRDPDRPPSRSRPTRHPDRPPSGPRWARARGRVLIAGGALLGAWWLVLMVLITAPSTRIPAWYLPPQAGILFLLALPMGVGMLAAGSAALTHRPAWRWFGIGTVLGVLEPLPLATLIVVVFGPILGQRRVQRTSSALEAQVLNLWVVVGAAVAVGLLAAWIARSRGRRPLRWGLVGVLGVAVVAALLAAVGWLPFQYWKPPTPGPGPFG